MCLVAHISIILNLSTGNDEPILQLVKNILRKDLVGTKQIDLKDGILFIRCFNLKRKKARPSIIVELPGPKESTLTLARSRLANLFKDYYTKATHSLKPSQK